MSPTILTERTKFPVDGVRIHCMCWIINAVKMVVIVEEDRSVCLWELNSTSTILKNILMYIVKYIVEWINCLCDGARHCTHVSRGLRIRIL